MVTLAKQQWLAERNIESIPAKNTGKLRSRIDGIVIHSTETPRNGKPWARIVARTFAVTKGVASAHFVLDSEECFECVPINRVANHAKSKGDVANQFWVGIELCGYHYWTEEQWLSDGGKQLVMAAQLIAGIGMTENIPLNWVTPDEINEGYGGIATHVDFTIAGKVMGGHIDPGNHFPKDYLIDLVWEWTNAIGTTRHP